MEVHHERLVGGRADLGTFCNQWGLLKKAVEIGTDRGLFAFEFLNKWRGEMLYCVDPYQSYSEMPWDRLPDLLAAQVLLQQTHPARHRICKMTSREMACYFCEFGWEADFVYIDGDHSEERVYCDLQAWWSLIRKGGVLAGDDWGPSHPGVEAAVRLFCQEKGIERVNLVSDYNREDSWYVCKS